MPARAQVPGVTATEITIGQSMPYSGPLAAYGVLGRAELALVKMINDHGGVAGRKINLLSLDDAYSPPKTIEATRRLVEDDNVFLIFGTLGTPGNAAIQKYLNVKKVPQLFVISGGDRFADPEQFPMTIPLYITYHAEGRIYAHYIRDHIPNAKVAVLYQNDDLGKDCLKALIAGLGTEGTIVSSQSFEPGDPSVDSQVVSAAGSGAGVMVFFGTGRAGAQTIRKVHDLDWHPMFFVGSPTAGNDPSIRTAGYDNATGILSVAWLKNPADPQWDRDQDMMDFRAFLKDYFPEDPTGINSYNGFLYVHALQQVLLGCASDMTRACVMHQATHLSGMRLPLLLPGLTIDTSPTDYRPLKKLWLQRFNGARWELVGAAPMSE